MKMIHRRGAENAERKFFFRSGDADLKKRLRLAGSFSNPVLCPKGCEAFVLSASQRQDKIYLFSADAASRMTLSEVEGEWAVKQNIIHDRI